MDAIEPHYGRVALALGENTDRDWRPQPIMGELHGVK
jgi:hypothetical protein